MPLSKKKQEKAEMKRRRDNVDARSLNGKGSFLDANVEADVRKYLETGDEEILLRIPDYRPYRKVR